MSGLRLTLDRELKIESPPDIREALNDWRMINLNPLKWATFEAIQFEHVRVVRVEWGWRIGFELEKEIAIQTLSYYLVENNKVEVTRLTHT